MVDEPKPLYLPDTPDRYYLAVPSGQLDLTRGIKGELSTVTFMLTDPVAYGDSQTASLSSGGSASINVNGTAPTYLNVVANSAVGELETIDDEDVYTWGILADNSSHVNVLTGSSSARKVEIYSEMRICKVANALKLPTLDSDWFVLQPGTHTIEMAYGTGAATLSWVERWY